MGAIPEKFLRVGLIIVCVYFIVVGIFIVAYNSYELAVPFEAAKERDEEDKKNVRTEAIVAIIGGCLEAAIGIFGLIAVILKKRLLLLIFAVTLTLAVIMNIVTMIAVGLMVKRVKSESVTNAKDNMIRLYGNKTNDVGLDYTMEVNSHQRQVGCCGWSNDPADNIYLRTPFYIYANRFRTDRGSTASNDSKMTLPESCCIRVSPDCYRTKDLKKARADRFVYEYDCLAKMVSDSTFYLVLIFLKGIFASILQILTVTATVMHVLQIV